MIRVLCLDIEGGFGGSSRSLYESLRHIDRTRVTASVWCAKQGPILARYAAVGIAARVEHPMPRVSSLPRLSRNVLAFARYARDWARAADFRRRFLDASRGVDLVHFNHESLFGLAAWLRKHSGCAITMHIRTNLWPGPFARLQTRAIARAVDALAYITENERESFGRNLAGRRTPDGDVIYNIAEEVAAAPDPQIPRDGRLVVCCLSSYAWARGVDRIVDIAHHLRELGRRDILFVVAGDMRLRGSLPGMLGEIAAARGTLADYAARRSVGDMIMFLGHVAEPERVLAAADLLIKPTRESNPWGRDILEALAAGRPALSVGTYDKFIEDGVTGVLQGEFDAAALARRIASLADDRAAVGRMGDAARKRVASLCNGRDRARDLEDFWRRAADRRRHA